MTKYSIRIYKQIQNTRGPGHTSKDMATGDHVRREGIDGRWRRSRAILLRQEMVVPTAPPGLQRTKNFSWRMSPSNEYSTQKATREPRDRMTGTET